MIKTIIFDFNGTVLDDRELCLSLVNEMLKDSGKSKITMERYLDVFDFPVKDYYNKLGLKTDSDSFTVLAEWFSTEYMRRYIHESHIYSELHGVINRLKHDYKLVLLSASFDSNLRKQVRDLGISEWFTDVKGTANIDASGKKELIEQYILSNNLSPHECCFVGDTIHDYEVGSAVGAMVVLVACGHQSRSRLINTPAITIDSVAELPKILVGLNGKSTEMDINI